MTYEIKDGVTPPQGTRGRRFVYPFLQMAPGQHFDAPPEKAQSARAAACQFARKYGRTMATETQPDGSLRIWRTA